MVHPLLDAVRPVADAIGATVVERPRVIGTDIALQWEGRGGRRRAPAGGVARHRLVPRSRSNASWARSLAELDREDKQRAVKLLNERGAFQLRKSVEQVAEVLGVSRFTVYNYLNRPEAG